MRLKPNENTISLYRAHSGAPSTDSKSQNRRAFDSPQLRGRTEIVAIPLLATAGKDLTFTYILMAGWKKKLKPLLSHDLPASSASPGPQLVFHIW